MDADAEAARRPWTDADGPRAGADREPAAARDGLRTAARDRLRAAVLAGSALTALVAGGWWWQTSAPATSAPATGPAAAAPAPSAQSRSGYVPGSGDGVVSVWALPGDRDGGATFRVDPLTGAAFRVDSGGRTAVRIDSEARRLNRLPNTIWRERATLNRENGRVVKQAAGEAATRFLLQYRCTGPGELLVVLERIRSAAPFPAVECDGTVVSIELTAVGGPFRVSLSTADAEPLRVDAQLVALP